MSAPVNVEHTPWTVGRLLSWTTDYFVRSQVPDARLACEVLLAHAAGCRRIDLYARFDKVLEGTSLERFREWVRRAAAHEPIAYLVGEKEFFSLPFRVTPDVLIPRPETETLVECVIDHCRAAGLTLPRVLDLGTGSGCIAIAVLVQLRGAVAVATDDSGAALDVARFNAERHGVSERLTLLEADRLALPKEAVPDGGWDVLVCNPPYVAASAMDTLAPTVRDFEPQAALTDGHDGLSFYRTMAANAARLLRPSGVVMVEVGDGQATAVIDIMATSRGWLHQGIWKDRVMAKERVLAFGLAAEAAPTYGRG